MSKRGLPATVQMRHDFHYVEEISRANRTVGKVLPIDKIEPNPEQPRSEFGDLSELTESIREKGVLEPLLVKPTGEGKWMIIAGERRWRASNLAGLTEVPCIELDIDEHGVAEIALIENLQRKDLTIWEEADGLAALKEKFGYTNDEIAKKISKSRTTVTECMAIAGLPAEIRDRCRAANINSKATLLEIARQFDEAAMFEFLDNLQNGSVRAKRGRKEQPVANPQLRQASGSEGSAEPSPNSFKYIAFDDSFEVEVRFRDGSDTGNSKVLKALKEAFDAVKDGRTQL